MALTVQTSQNSTPSTNNPDGSAAFPISINAVGASGSFADGSIVTLGTEADTAWSGSGSGTAISVLKKIAAGGGGGGAVTAASGAFVDGSIVTIGTEADAAWSGSGSGTVISVLKKIASAGGSAVSIADGADVAQGTTTDPAWSGSGASTLVAALKAIYTKVVAIITALGSPMQQTGGSVTANAGTNLNTSLLALEGGGNLASIKTNTTGVALAANQPALNVDGGAPAHVTNFPANAAQETGGNLAIAATAITAIASGTPATLGQMPMAKSQSVVIAGDQPTPPSDRLRGAFLAEQLLFAMNAPSNGFVPVEIPVFLAGF